ncbi:MAG: chemotaxis response regulator protein-glutamate methylesterase [Candidatus Acidiferrales bacterium]
MKPVRIFVVDDSMVVRKIVCDTLAEDPALEIAGTTSDGRSALAKLPLMNADLVTLDIEMEGMSGLETLAEIRKIYPKLPVIMYSTLTERGASATLEALSLGASDYATKPEHATSPAEARENIRAELIPKIKSLCRVGVERRVAPRASVPSLSGKIVRPSRRRIEIVAIGTSTGGPKALSEVLPSFPQDFPVPIVIVQHMPPVFTRQLAERLSSRSAIAISEGTEGVALQSGHAWIAPGNFHMTVGRSENRNLLHLNQGPQENSCRPSVDVLFRSVAQLYGPGALAVVMTGMGSDGARGAEQIRNAGGEVIVQDEATSVVWGMPGIIYAAGNADGVYPLNQLEREVTRRVVESRGRRAVAGSENAHAVENVRK